MEKLCLTPRAIYVYREQAATFISIENYAELRTVPRSNCISARDEGQRGKKLRRHRSKKEKVPIEQTQFEAE